ncbi:MAG: hypothetical protein Q9172_006091 [Xanthocarpia lactea]
MAYDIQQEVLRIFAQVLELKDKIAPSDYIEQLKTLEGMIQCLRAKTEEGLSTNAQAEASNNGNTLTGYVALRDVMLNPTTPPEDLPEDEPIQFSPNEEPSSPTQPNTPELRDLSSPTCVNSPKAGLNGTFSFPKPDEQRLDLDRSGTRSEDEQAGHTSPSLSPRDNEALNPPEDKQASHSSPPPSPRDNEALNPPEDPPEDKHAGHPSPLPPSSINSSGAGEPDNDPQSPSSQATGSSHSEEGSDSLFLGGEER